MTDRRAAQNVASSVSRAIDASGDSLESVAQAADLTTPALDARLKGVTPFSIRELVKVGGFLRSKPDSFLIGAR